LQPHHHLVGRHRKTGHRGANPGSQHYRAHHRITVELRVIDWRPTAIRLPAVRSRLCGAMPFGGCG
jgi:hypothetical protein